MTNDEQMMAFLEYAGPRLDYILDRSRGMTKEAAPSAGVRDLLELVGSRIGKWFNGGKEALKLPPAPLRRAGEALDPAVRRAARMEGLEAPVSKLGGTLKALGLQGLASVNSWTAGIPGDTLKWLSRMFGADVVPIVSKGADGVEHVIGERLTRGAGNGILNSMYRAGDWIQRNTTRRIDRMIRQNAVDMGRAGMSRKLIKRLNMGGRIGAETAVLGGVITAPMIWGQGSPQAHVAEVLEKPFDWFHPIGWGIIGATRLLNAAQQKGFDSAADAAYQTQEGILEGIRNAGRMGHMAGVVDPDLYINKARARIEKQMRERFAQQAANLGVENTFDKMIAERLERQRKMAEEQAAQQAEQPIAPQQIMPQAAQYAAQQATQQF